MIKEERKKNLRKSKPLTLDSFLFTEKFINILMFKGKRYSSIRFFQTVFLILNKQYRTKNPILILNRAINNVSPLFQIKIRKLGKKRSIIIPFPITSNRLRNFLGVKWLLESCSSRKESTLAKRFAAEVIDAFENEGLTKKKQEESHIIALMHKSAINFNW